MTNAKFVISLDFELFWGVSDRQTVGGYGRNVLGEWEAIPRMLALFCRHGLRVTWATVGMVMCRDYKHWCDIRPGVMPLYRANISPYCMDSLVKENAGLFFARPLVERILATSGQELATHTYSHFYCGEAGATPDQFAADLACAGIIAADMGANVRSVVLPRNQIVEKFLAVLPGAGIEVYRGNAQHWLYRNGDAVVGGLAGRVARFADACLPLSGNRTVRERCKDGLINVPASLFLYPWSTRHRALSALRLHRVKQGMTSAAQTGGVFHLWWHPHNFGVNLKENLAMLEVVLRHYQLLADVYGMRTHCLGDFAPSADPAFRAGSQASLHISDPAAMDPMKRVPA
jgi:hypothetical protein